MHQLFDPSARTRNSELFQQRAKLHNECNLASRKILANNDRRDQRQRHKHVRLDVKSRDQPNDRFQDDRDPAENDRHPRRIHTADLQSGNARHEGDPGNDQKYNVAFCSAPLEQGFQAFNHDKPPLCLL